MLRRLLWKNKSRSTLVGAFLGNVMGLCIVIFMFQVIMNVMAYFNSDDSSLGGQFLILNKKVSILNTASVVSNTFSDEEILAISEQSFTSSVAPFVANQFTSRARLQPDESQPGLYTEIFFEAVPDHFIDVDVDNWDWAHGQENVPIIIPRPWLSLYNAFAPSQGLPAVSAKTIEKVQFNLIVKGNGKDTTYLGRIVGFSDRINTILVPIEFLEEANRVYGHTTKEPTRVLIEVKNTTDPELLAFLEENSYETDREKLRNGIVAKLLREVGSVVFAIGFIVFFLAILIFYVSFKLIITESRENIRTLIYLGYRIKDIIQFYSRQFIIINGVVLIFALLAVQGSQFLLQSLVSEQDITLPTFVSPWTIAFGGGILLLIVAMNYFSTKWTIQSVLKG